VAVTSARPYANHLHLAPDRYPLQHLITQFLQIGCSSLRPTNSVKALKANYKETTDEQYYCKNIKNYVNLNSIVYVSAAQKYTVHHTSSVCKYQCQGLLPALQVSSTHSSDWKVSALWQIGLFAGKHWRWRVLLPTPHVTLHEDHGLHVDQNAKQTAAYKGLIFCLGLQVMTRTHQQMR